MSIIGGQYDIIVLFRLLCHGQPEPNVLIKLYDHDTLSIDDLMNTAYTDSRGYFEVSGVAHEFLTIDAKLNFYHGMLLKFV